MGRSPDVRSDNGRIEVTRGLSLGLHTTGRRFRVVTIRGHFVDQDVKPSFVF